MPRHRSGLIATISLAALLAGMAPAMAETPVEDPGVEAPAEVSIDEGEPQAIPLVSISEPVTVPLPGPPTDLASAIDAIAPDTIRDILYADFGNGDPTALVLTTDCDGEFCRWDFVARMGEHFGTLGSAYAAEVEFIDVDGGKMIWSDGVTWAYTGGFIYPWGSVADGMRERPGGPDEIDLVAGWNEYIALEELTVSVVEIDLLDDGTNQRILFLGGLGAFAGEKGYPFLIVTSDDTILHAGYSQDRPQFFRLAGGGVTIATNAFGQFELTDIRPAKTDEPVAKNGGEADEEE